MLQVKGETQVNFERENRTLFLSCLSFEKKSHPSGWTYVGWLLSSEIAGCPRCPKREKMHRSNSSYWRSSAAEQRLGVCPRFPYSSAGGVVCFEEDISVHPHVEPIANRNLEGWLNA